MVKKRPIYDKPECVTMSHGTKITNNNKKMGKYVSSVSRSTDSCPKDAPCRLENGGTCYIGNMKPSVRASYQHNEDLILSDDKLVFLDVCEYIDMYAPKYFRWFVGGDIGSIEFLDGIVTVAERYPSIQFLVFTKWYSIVEDYIQEDDIPGNLHIRMSVWKDYGPSADLLERFGGAYYDDGTPECRIPSKAYVCPDDCEKCHYKCFRANNRFNVVFPKH